MWELHRNPNSSLPRFRPRRMPFAWCHFRMITDLEYLSLSVLEYMRNKIYFAESQNDILSRFSGNLAATL